MAIGLGRCHGSQQEAPFLPTPLETQSGYGPSLHQGMEQQQQRQQQQQQQQQLPASPMRHSCSDQRTKSVLCSGALMAGTWQVLPWTVQFGCGTPGVAPTWRHCAVTPQW
jgi:hypothetical protein